MKLYFVIEIGQGPFNTILADCTLKNVTTDERKAKKLADKLNNKCLTGMSGKKLFKYLVVSE